MNPKNYLLVIVFYSGLFEMFAQVSPLLTTTWNQGCYYNAMCPVVSTGGACGHAWTGCNATAIAQILKYYNYPTSGLGNHCNANFPTHCVDFSLQNYDYSLMPAQLTGPNSEVAKLMYHVGIAVDMAWSGTNSTSFFEQKPLKKYFKYSPKMYPTATFMFNTTAELIDAIKKELDSGRPVYAKGGNHFYLIDGYNSANQFHINFGWGGTYDGYYPITNVVNGAGNFSPGNFIFHIRPLWGTLELAKDTLFLPATASYAVEIEFTSLETWTMSTDASWITLNMNTGTPGYYSYQEGSSFNTSINHGDLRIGRIFVANSIDTDTLVVVQSASPLQATPDTLIFPNSGGSQSVQIAYLSYATWSASASDSWISINPSTGTGHGVVHVSVAPNTQPYPLIGYIVFSGGDFKDTVVIKQMPAFTTSVISPEFLYHQEVSVFPLPAQNTFSIESLFGKIKGIEILDMTGKSVLLSQKPSQFYDISHLPEGIYLLKIYMYWENHEKVIFRKLVKN